jgi:outer membrane protein TolC
MTLNEALRMNAGLLILLSVSAFSMIACAPYAGDRGMDRPPLAKEQALQRVQPSATSQALTPSGPLTVERAIEDALSASPELGQIHRRMDAAAEQVRQAEAAFYPRVVFVEEFSITDNPVFAFMQLLNQRRLTFAMDFNNPGIHQNVASRVQGEWSLFEGGARLNSRSAAMHQRESIAAELMAARNRLVATVMETYYRWLQALGFIGVADQALDSARTSERLGEARVRAEAALPSELFRLKARTAEAQANCVTARTGARRLQAGLERLMARSISPREIPDPALPAKGETPGSAPQETGSLVEQALEQRPELTAVRDMILAARDRVRAARGELLPRIGARAQYEWDSEDLRGGGQSWLVGIQATWNLFQGGLTLSRIREADARRREMEARGEQLALDIALEVHQAALGVQEAAAKILVAAERREWARRGLEEVRNLYANQVVGVDSLLQAEVDWNRAEVSHTAALFDGKIAQTALRQALGEFAEWVEVRRE